MNDAQKPQALVDETISAPEEAAPEAPTEEATPTPDEVVPADTEEPAVTTDEAEVAPGIAADQDADRAEINDVLENPENDHAGVGHPSDGQPV